MGIMLATGTGIAPMRSYLRLLFNDKAGADAAGNRKFKGLAWLFMGVPYSKSLLYDDEHKEYTSKYADQFRYDYAVSREQEERGRAEDVHPDEDGRVRGGALGADAETEHARVHVRAQGHGEWHGGVLQPHRREGRPRLEGVCQVDEEGWTLPCRGLLSAADPPSIGRRSRPCSRFAEL